MKTLSIVPTSREALQRMLATLAVSAATFGVFLGTWSFVAARIQVSFGAVPGPGAVWTEARNLWSDHLAERRKAGEFYERQAARKAEFLRESPEEEWTEMCTAS